MTTTVADDRLAALLLAQRLVEADVRPLKASEYWTVVESVGSPGVLLGHSTVEIRDMTGVDSDLAHRVAGLLDHATAFAFHLDDLERSGLRAISSVDEAYPETLRSRLGRAAPPILYVAGPPALMSSVLFGIVGSRDVDPAGAAIAQKAAHQAVAQGSGVVSGGAKGVDRLAMTAALEAGGSVVGVVADSLTKTLRDPDLRRAIADGQVCMCTPNVPTAGFSVGNAMGRNKLIYALSAATLVVSATHDSGGTWAGAVEALRQAIVPVLVWTGPGGGDGNVALAELGATALEDLDQLFPLPDPAVASVVRRSGQLSLGI